ncbi:hypothetical protein HDA40_001921 [Hamadaea flava]|uniref:DUF3846 domain-containing protein n=1 Tax=Hamadaea flava TaxID=1742688 RepID=A0ABV8LEI4_9ACTN|nr:DUF3846 domain-containing protein [Hamadaea flava]MCP2323414.1 hypothetical protein [Hamadaea flava]
MTHTEFRLLVVHPTGRAALHVYRELRKEDIGAVLNAAVAGPLELLADDGAITTWCNEEGARRGQAPNRPGSALAQRYGASGDVRAGLIAFSGSDGNETVNLTDRQIDLLLDRLAAINACHDSQQ